MPVTPFHLLAITPVKAIIPKKFSWSVFALANIMIDLEPITVFLVTLEPRHLFFHTIIGATLIGILCATLGKKWCEIAINIWNEELQGKFEERWLKSEPKISNTAAWISALSGAWTHLLLDSFMHDDIRPLSPFTDANRLLGLISIGWLHTLCLMLGLLGCLLLLIRKA